MIIEGIMSRPEMNFTASAKAVCTFNVDGTKCVAWEELAEQINQYIKEGYKVKVYGYEKERWWTIPGGEKRSAMEFTINRIKVTDKPKPVENCCFYCKRLEVDCLNGCYNSLGGASYMKDCLVEDGKCAEEGIDNKECFEVRG